MKEPHELQPGEYTKYENVWYACTPNGLLANLGNHGVTEHPDGTISVTPSILVTKPYFNRAGHSESYHGYLTNGQWKEC